MDVCRRRPASKGSRFERGSNRREAGRIVSLSVKKTPDKLRTYKLILCFDGGAYQGWQSQLKNNTIQEKLESAFHKIFKYKINAHGSSRTDAGVHALGMCVSVRIPDKLSPSTLRDALNYYLPEDICVKSVAWAHPQFHARFDALRKHYRYRIHTGRVKPGLDRRYVYWVPATLDLLSMKKAAAYLEGRHDFRSFADKLDSNEKTHKRIYKLSLRRRGHEIIVDVVGDSFLRHMVRVLAGTLIAVGRGNLAPSELPKILRARDRKLSPMTAPARGLCLHKVYYA